MAFEAAWVSNARARQLATEHASLTVTRMWIADKLKTDRAELCIALDREVRAQCSALERDFAL